MRELTPAIMEEAVTLINRLRSGTLTEEGISDTVMELRCLLPDPYFMGYTVNHTPRLPAEDVVRRAFEYKPLLL